MICKVDTLRLIMEYDVLTYIDSFDQKFWNWFWFVHINLELKKTQMDKIAYCQVASNLSCQLTSALLEITQPIKCFIKSMVSLSAWSVKPSCRNHIFSRSISYNWSHEKFDIMSRYLHSPFTVNGDYLQYSLFQKII